MTTGTFRKRKLRASGSQASDGQSYQRFLAKSNCITGGARMLEGSSLLEMTTVRKPEG